MPDWLKRKLLGQEDLEPEPLPHVPGSVSAVRDKWAQQLREIEEMAAAGNPVPVPARLTSDPVGIADGEEWTEMVHREVAASRGGGDETHFAGGQHQSKNLYNVLLSKEFSSSSSSEKNSDSWFNRWM